MNYPLGRETVIWQRNTHFTGQRQRQQTAPYSGFYEWLPGVLRAHIWCWGGGALGSPSPVFSDEGMAYCTLPHGLSMGTRCLVPPSLRDPIGVASVGCRMPSISSLESTLHRLATKLHINHPALRLTLPSICVWPCKIRVDVDIVQYTMYYCLSIVLLKTICDMNIDVFLHDSGAFFVAVEWPACICLCLGACVMVS